VNRAYMIFIIRFFSTVLRPAICAVLCAVLCSSLFASSVAVAMPAQGQKIMVAGPSPQAPDIARDITSKGGNVVDVAVAVVMSMSVTQPYFASLGGGGFALIKMGTDVKALDFREIAPKKATETLFNDNDPNTSRDGGLAVGVPGIPAGLWAMHEKYGKLKWNQLFDAAIKDADKGFQVSSEWVENTEYNMKRFNKGGVKFFTHSDGTHLKPGDLLKQPQQIAMLKEIQKKGAKAFYEGAVARDIVASVNDQKGIFTEDDLKNYKVRWLEPITADFAGYKVSLMPPPSSGGVIIAQALKLIEKLKVTNYAPLSVDEFHYLIEIMKLSYRGRQLLGDPDFAKNPIAQLLDDKYLSDMAKLVKPDKAIDVEPLKTLPFEKEQTTHISIMDGAGNTIAMTITLNGDFGSGIVTSKYGISMNNEMDDFTTKPGQPNMFKLIQGSANLVRPGARPLSSMSPTIVEKNGRTVLSLGAPGGPRITTAVLQVLYRVLTQPFDIDQAIQAPRVHHQFLPNVVKIDKLKFSPEVLAALKARGHVIETGSTGKVYGIFRSEDGLLSGAADQRGESAAGGQ
jgi:gamma-glutamyltranspeptidase / glutathione hydrolase